VHAGRVLVFTKRTQNPLDFIGFLEKKRTQIEPKQTKFMTQFDINQPELTQKDESNPNFRLGTQDWRRPTQMSLRDLTRFNANLHLTMRAKSKFPAAAPFAIFRQALKTCNFLWEA
jgi:hypothetical protein